MNEQLESRLRAHLSTVDDQPVRDPGTVASSAARARVRLRARRRVAVGTASAVLAVAAVGIVWATRPETNDVVTSPGSSPLDSVASSESPVDTVVSPPPPPTTAPAAVATPIAPDPRGPSYDPSVVWTGTEAIVLGGRDSSGGIVSGASAYDPSTNSWRTVPEPPGPSDRAYALLVWTGTEVLVVGGIDDSGGPVMPVVAYDPSLGTWRTVVATSPSVMDRSPWAWTGDRLLVWAEGDTPLALDPHAASPMQSWIVPAQTPLDFRQSSASVWTGSEWIIWGGSNGAGEFADGAAYSPATNSWRVLAPSPLGTRRVEGVWTGTEMLVIAGSRGGELNTLALADGAAYDPATDTWRSLTSGPAHPGFVPVWTGTHVLMFAKGGMHVYEVGADEWLDCCDNEAFSAPGGTPVWTGDAVLAIGGDDPDSGGALFDPDL